MNTKKLFFSLILSAVMCVPMSLSAQITIGSGRAPSEWSLLDLCTDYQQKGLHNARMTTEQRNLLVPPGIRNEDAKGLMIFNTNAMYIGDGEYRQYIGCLEFWNGVQWISLCKDRLTPAYYISVPNSCGLTASNNNRTFTAIPDPNAIAYEFFVNGDSKGRQNSNVFNLPADVPDGVVVTFRYLFPESFIRPSFEERMVRVHGGTFIFGARTQSSINPPYQPTSIIWDSEVTLSDFYIARTPVTQAQFEAVMGFNPSSFQCNIGGNVYRTGAHRTLNNFTGTGFVPSSNRPVERVDWYLAVAFANRLSALEGRDIFYQVTTGDGILRDDPDFWLNLTRDQALGAHLGVDNVWTVSLPSNPQANNGYRLLTEAEWEFAARGGILSNSIVTDVPNSDYFFSNGNDSDYVWHTGNSGNTTQPVAQFRSNALGLYDMSGNIGEWVWDRWRNSGHLPTGTNPTGPQLYINISTRDRIVRGGTNSWEARHLVVTLRDRRNSFYSPRFIVGFRIAASAVE